MKFSPKEAPIIIIFCFIPIIILAQFDYSLIENDFHLRGTKYEITVYIFIPNPSHSVNGKHVSNIYKFNEYGRVVENIYFGLDKSHKKMILYKDSLVYDENQNLICRVKIKPKKKFKNPKSIEGKLKIEERLQGVIWGEEVLYSKFKYDSLNNITGYRSFDHEINESFEGKYKNRYDKEGNLEIRYSSSGSKFIPLDSFHIIKDSIFRYTRKVIATLDNKKVELNWPLWNMKFFHGGRNKYLINKTFGSEGLMEIAYNQNGFPLYQRSINGVYKSIYNHNEDNVLVSKSTYYGNKLVRTYYYEYKEI